MFGKSCELLRRLGFFMFKCPSGVKDVLPNRRVPAHRPPARASFIYGSACYYEEGI